MLWSGLFVERIFFAIGSILALFGVAAGAMGAHLLEGRLEPSRLETFELAARYQIYHALALLGVAWAVTRWPGNLAVTGGAFLILGVALFCGSLYALSFGAPRGLAMVTPFGGVSFMIGWAILAWAALRG